MNMDNVVLVRVMNNIPLDGELVPSCEGKILENDEDVVNLGSWLKPQRTMYNSRRKMKITEKN